MAGNWAGTYEYRAPRHIVVADEDELRAALAGNGPVHALGTRHSFTDLPDTAGTLIEMAAFDRPITIDEDARTVRVTAGTRYGVLAAQLHAAGWALHNTGSLPHISVGGATSTGTHGSGDGNGVLSSAVAGIRFLDAAGEAHEVSRGDADFEALVVGVGAFGILTELTLDIQPTYLVRQDLYADVTWETLLGDIDAVTSAGDSVSVFTRWGEDLGWVWVKRRATDAEATAPEELLGGRLSATLEPLGLGDNVTVIGTAGPWYERLPHFRADAEPSRGDEIQTEYFIDRADAAAALRAVREVVAPYTEHLIWTELRTAASDELWLSGAYQRDAFIIHFTWENHPAEVTEALTLIEPVLAPFNARPHWGKRHLMERADIERVVPRLADARAVFERLDPTGRFVNEHLVRVGLREAR
ncbi:FAD-binding protein [Microbacterium sp. M28]|uniref:D-arabinono-1,4-lactone oxidase n=1 Tax=Microbacterium sp. M28 TaxID=2962064 RepID=UPI0021F4301D|nr:D-arabinono-1,4-lactone oxidase [Microbacterium sp. M28]UYO96583.1 FAD-binding protein [Microbacterium sp. M28]